MTLSPHDGALFFQLMWKLQYYVNQKLGFNKNVSTVEEYTNLPTKKKLEARNALWERPELIETFVQENPHNLPAAELEIISKWKGCTLGSYFILRHLKKGSIFIGNDNQVYSVQGILDPLDEIMPSYALPQMVKAILLPFKGQIIYDGLLEGYSVHFGGGIRSGLNETYTAAKAKGRILDTLEPELAAAKPVKPQKDIRPQLKELQQAMKPLKGNSPVQNAALSLARAGVDLTIVDAENPSSDEIETQVRKIRKAANRLLNLMDILEED